MLCSAVRAQAGDAWAELKSCRLLENQGNDADSFHVSCGGREYIFRLYFVDAPETDMSVPARVAEQAQYFGVTTAQAVQLGELGKRFTQQKLVRAFSVRTCMQDARGRSVLPREFAFVETAEGDLAELLVVNGLARVYGAAATPVGLNSPEVQWEKLHRLEERAKGEKVGAWGVASGRMTARSSTQPARSGTDSFEAFFHSAKPDVELSSTATPAPAGASSDEKLDVNTATSAELLQVRGVGPVLAGRIIAARPFASADDLRKVKGIGDKKYEQLRPAFR